MIDISAADCKPDASRVCGDVRVRQGNVRAAGGRALECECQGTRPSPCCCCSAFAPPHPVYLGCPSSRPVFPPLLNDRLFRPRQNISLLFISTRVCLFLGGVVWSVVRVRIFVYIQSIAPRKI